MVREASFGIFVAIAMALCLIGNDTLAQNVQRKTYVMSESMRRELASRDFDSVQIEKIVNGISNALASENLDMILGVSFDEIRITDKGINKVIKKEELAEYKDRLFKDNALSRTVSDENQFVLRSEEVGLGRGAFWISETCLDHNCEKKKTLLITINLP